MPRDCPGLKLETMTFEQVRVMFSLLAKLGVLARMRPGEIFGLK
jgi:hypothetical protein